MKKKEWSEMSKTEKTIGIIAVLVIIFGIMSLFSGSSDNRSEETTSNQPQAQEEMVESNIKVTSQIIKKVDGKYRYFFDIRNLGENNFEGSVTISIVTAKGSTIGKETFNATKPIEPQLGSPVYIDANTGPKQVHGENGASTFTYEVRIGNNKTDSGNGELTDNFEDLSGF